MSLYNVVWGAEGGRSLYYCGGCRWLLVTCRRRNVISRSSRWWWWFSAFSPFLLGRGMWRTLPLIWEAKAAVRCRRTFSWSRVKWSLYWCSSTAGRCRSSTRRSTPASKNTSATCWRADQTTVSACVVGSAWSRQVQPKILHTTWVPLILHPLTFRCLLNRFKKQCNYHYWFPIFFSHLSSFSVFSSWTLSSLFALNFGELLPTSTMFCNIKVQLSFHVSRPVSSVIIHTSLVYFVVVWTCTPLNIPSWR